MSNKSNASRANANNHSNQLNPNNAAYWSSRGLPVPSSGYVEEVARNTPPPDACPVDEQEKGS